MLAYAMFFLVVGFILLAGHVAKQESLKNYRLGRRWWALAFLLLGMCGINEIIHQPLAEGRSYPGVYIAAVVSYIHAWLNAYGYLLMLDAEKPRRKPFQRFAVIGLPLLIAGGYAFIHLPEWHRAAGIALGFFYVIEAIWLLTFLYKEYESGKKALSDYDSDETIRKYSWMQFAINLTVILAALNLVNFYTTRFNLLLRVLNIAFYAYFAMRIIDFQHVFSTLDAARRMEKKEEELEKEIKEEEKASSLSSTKAAIYEKIEPLLNKWIEKKGYLATALTLSQVAAEIGTNQTYLSLYLNKKLEMTFQTWLNSLRIQHAQTILLDYPDKNLEEICRLSGYDKAYSFSRWFKQVTGESITQFKQSHQLS